MSEPTTNPTGRANSDPEPSTEQREPGVDLRVGDRITVLPGKARSAHTRAVLTRGFAIDITSLRPDFDGAIEVTGILLTTRGAWRTAVPTRSMIATPGAYTMPIRIGGHRAPPGHRRNPGSDRDP
jgi:hypothetical protein